MKILVLSNLYPPDFLGGYELACRQVVDALRRRGHDVRVLTTAPAHPGRRRRRTSAAVFELIDEWNHYTPWSTAADRREPRTRPSRAWSTPTTSTR